MDWIQLLAFAVSLGSLGLGAWFVREAWRKLNDPDPWQRMRWPLAATLAFPNVMFGALLMAIALAAPWK